MRDIKVRTIQMSVNDFIAIKPNPIQRDTERHANLHSKKPFGHLAEYHPAHQKVSIAEMPSGKRYKLDGHSRAMLWDLGALEPPKKLSVDVFSIQTTEELKDLYLTFDNAAATESASDQLYGAMNYFGLKPRSRLFQNTGTLSAMKVLVFPSKWQDVKYLSTVQLVEPHIPALTIINESDHIRNHFYFPRYVFCAMLMTVTAHGKKAMEFWDSYALQEGTKQKDKADGIFMAMQRFDYIRLELTKKMSGGSQGAITKQTPYFLYCFDMWGNDAMIPLRQGQKLKSELPSLSGWWKLNVGDYYYPDLHKGND